MPNTFHSTFVYTSQYCLEQLSAQPTTLTCTLCDSPWQNHFPLRHNFCCALGDTRAKCLGGIPFALYGSMPRVSNRLVDTGHYGDRQLNFEIVSASLERNMEFEAVLHKGLHE